MRTKVLEDRRDFKASERQYQRMAAKQMSRESVNQPRDQPQARGWLWRAKLKASALRGFGQQGQMNTSGNSCALILQARHGWARKWDYADSVPSSAHWGLPPKRRVSEGEMAKAMLEVTVSALVVPARMALCSGVSASVSFPYVVLI